AFHVDVEYLLVKIFCYLAKAGILRHAGIGEHDVEPAFLVLDLREQAIEVVEVRHVSLKTGCISADLVDRRRQLRLAAPRYEHGGAFLHELPCSRETDAAVPSGYQGDLSRKLAAQAALVSVGRTCDGDCHRHAP